MILPEDVERMGQLGLSVHMSPYWIVRDESYDLVYEPYLGARADQTYPLRSLIDAGVNVTVASDFITSEPDLMTAVHRGVTRSLLGGAALPPTSETVSVDEMLRAATVGGAHANFLDGEVGSLVVGKKADLVVLIANPLELDVDQIPGVEVEMTFFEGTRVH